MIDKKLMGKKSRAAGQRFELKVREDLEKKGWVVDKWSNNVEFTRFNVSGFTKEENDVVDAKTGKLVKAKAKWAGPGRPMMLGSGFPDFIAHAPTGLSRLGYFKVIGVESKMDGILDKKEKQKAKWLLNNHIFSKILIAKKGIKRGQIVYDEFKSGR